MNALNRKIENFRHEFNEAMKEAKSATEEAMDEFTEASRQSKVNARYARMYAYKLQKAIKNLGRVPGLAVSSERDETKDGAVRDTAYRLPGTWPADFDAFDENDYETEAERRQWAARDSYDMRDGK